MKYISLFPFFLCACILNAADSTELLILTKVGLGYKVSSSQKPLREKAEQKAYNSIIHDTANFVDHGTELRKIVFQKDLGTANEIFDAINKEEKILPYFLLSECRASICALTRKAEVLSYRDRFEQDILQFLSPPLLVISNRHKITVLIFAAGGLLSEAKIIASLIKSGIKIKYIYLVDKRYSRIMKNLKLENNVTELSIDSLDELTIDEKEMCKVKQIKKLLFIELIRLKQFINFIAHTTHTTHDIPNLIIYNSAPCIIEDKKAGIVKGTDLLIGIDFMEGDGPAIWQATDDYANLVLNLMPRGSFCAALNCREGEVQPMIIKKSSQAESEIFSYKTIELYSI